MASEDLKSLLGLFDEEENGDETKDTFYSLPNDSEATLTDTDASYVTCNQTLTMNSDDEDRVKTPILDALTEDRWNELEHDEEEKNELNDTVLNMKERIIAENLMKKESSVPVIEKRNNVEVFMGDLTSKTNKIKKELTKKDEFKAFDSFFTIRVMNPKITSTILNTYCTGFKKVKVSSLRMNNQPSGEWFTIGVIVEKTDYRKSAKNNEYMIWKISDLINFQDTPVKVLLFGECVKQHWKLPEGSVIALTCPQFAESTDNKTITLKLIKPAQVVDIGICPDYGRCKGNKMDGEKCTNYVNVSTSEYCVYHITKAANKITARRAALNSEYNAPIGNRISKPKLNNGGFNDDKNSPHVFIRAKLSKEELLEEDKKSAISKTISKEEIASVKEAENTKLEELKAKKFNIGARNLKLLKEKEQKIVESKKTIKPPVDLKNFLKEQQSKMNQKRPMLSSRPPMMELVVENKPKSQQLIQAEINRQRLIEKIRKEGGIPKSDPNKLRPLKRSATNVEEKSMIDKEDSEIKKSKLMKSSTGKTYSKDDMKALLERKSKHEDVINEVQKEKENKYFNSMEIREKIETKLTETTEIKNVKVVTCKKCNYTNEKQSNFCMIQGHPVQRHTANKRFFKCQACKHRITIFDFLPVKPCEKCGCTAFDKVGLRDERKVEGPKLLIRGEERTFVNK